MDKKLIVKQNGFKDCGPSCLLSIMKYYGCEASHEEVTYILKTDIDGTNAYNIINGSKSFGFDGYGIHYTYENIINKEVSFPIICHTLKNGMYHFIVVYDVLPNKVVVMDPSSNITKISYEEFENMYLGTSLVIYPVKKFSKVTKHKTLFDFILDYIILERKSSIRIIIYSLLSLILGVLGNYYTLICIDKVLPNYEFNYLIKVSVIFLISFIIKSVFSYIKNKYVIKIERNISLNINNDVIRKYFNLPYQFFKSKSVGESISRLNDLDVFREVFIDMILNITTDMILVMISFIILLSVNVKLFALGLLELFVYYLVVLLFKRTFSRKNEDMLVKQGVYYKSLSESINGYETNKNLNMNNEIIKKLEIDYISYLDKIKSYKRVVNKQLLIKDNISNIFTVVSVFVSIVFIKNKIISLGEFMLFNSIVYYFKEPLKNILDLEPNLNYVKSIYNRINDLIIMKNKDYEMKVNNIKGDITFEELSYSYDGMKNIFNKVSFKIKYGSKFLIYADSGVGKSTIIKILLKYFDKYDGQVYIGNVNLKDIAPINISHNMTYVSQGSYINNDTLKNNIVYGRNVSDEEYERVLEVCNLKHFRDTKMMRNNFMIEDNGFNISGGERQKIILARSILKKSNYLILDEALSEVGLKEEIEIMKKIFDIFKDKTIIYISHKEEVINRFDLKYKLEGSEVL